MGRACLILAPVLEPMFQLTALTQPMICPLFTHLHLMHCNWCHSISILTTKMWTQILRTKVKQGKNELCNIMKFQACHQFWPYVKAPFCTLKAKRPRYEANSMQGFLFKAKILRSASQPPILASCYKTIFE